MKQNESVFHNLIFKGGWMDHPCGTGSLLENTANLRKKLPKVAKDLNLKVIFDAPCGDYSWMNTVSWDTEIKYIGGDLVLDLINDNKQKFPHIEFMHIDIINDKLPESDLMICRDCLIHFSWADIKKFFINFTNSNIKYIGITNYVPGENYDINTGECHHIDLMSHPVNLPKPTVEILDKENTSRPCTMSIWKQSDIKSILNNF